MNRFLIMFKKEIKDIITLQTVIPIIIVCAMFLLMGTFMNDLTGSFGTPEEGAKASAENTIGIIDRDETEGSRYLIDIIGQSGYHIFTPAQADPEEAYNKNTNSFDVLIVIPEGFGRTFIGESSETAQVAVYSTVKSFSMTAMFSGSAVTSIIDSINHTMSQSLMEHNLKDEAPSLEFIQNPIETVEYSRVNEKIAKASPSSIVNVVTSQTLFVPLIIFIIIVFSSQTLAASVTGEKADKTLETLLTTPVKRTHILISKMLSASIISLAYAVIFLLSYDNMMSGTMGSESGAMGDMTPILKSVGISFDFKTYLIVGISLFLSILIGLSIAIILGVLAEDMKKLQGILSPFMIIMMIPYLISMFTDINTLPVILRSIMYIIPFTHTFTAINNIFTSNYLMLAIGIVYQFVFLLVSIGFATHVFGTDKIFTLKIEFGRKKKNTAEN